MAINGTRKGNQLILTIDLAEKPTVSKSAIAKAIKAGQDPSKVEPTMLATTGGFMRFDGCKVSLNVTV